jgi:uncharacterized membrane protein YfcA
VTPESGLAIAGAGLAAGAINTIVGSGSLITFPTLVALGYPAVLANVSNTVGLVPGSVSGTIGYRRELVGQRRRAVTLSIVGGAGGLAGAVLLLALPGTVFERVVPALILLACALVAIQPRLSRRLAARSEHPRRGGLGLITTVGLTGIYGGYFGAAQGVILIALLAIAIDDDLQRLNATKNVIAAVVNAVAGLLFIAIAHVSWGASALIAAGAIIGGQLGATLGRRLPDWLLRGLIIVIGVGVSIKLLMP